MGGSKKNDEESLLQAIKFYQNGLIRYMERNDELKMSHGLNKLSSYPIRMCHLQDTGVGRTVNLLVKMDGKVGEQARSLIAKWKQMVEEEKEAQNEDSHSEDSRESLEQRSDRESDGRDCVSERSSTGSSSNSDEENKKSEKENRGSKRHRSSRESESRKSSDRRRHDSRDSKRHKSSHDKSDEQSRGHKSRSERENSISSRLGEENSSPRDIKHTSHSSKHDKQNNSRHEKEKTSRQEKEHSSRHEKKHSSKHEKDDTKHVSNRESSKRRDEKSHKDKHKQEERNENSKRGEQRPKESSTNKDKNDRSDREKDKNSHKEKKERDDKYHKKENEKSNREKDRAKEVPTKRDEDKKGNKIEKIQSSKHCKTEISSESGTSFADALGMLEMSRKEKKSHTKDTSSSKPSSESVRHFGDVSEPKKEKESSSKHKKSEMSSEAGTSSRKERKTDKKEKTSSSKHGKNELSSESGASFEEALGMMEVPKKEKKSFKKKREEEERSSIGYEESEICSSSGTTFEEALGMVEAPRKKKKVTDRPVLRTPSPVENENTSPIVPLPSIPLEKITVNITLPSITPNYKPIRIPDSLHSHNETEFMDNFMKNKHHRTKIYSGNKSAYTKVPSLFDICVQLLQVHIDAIEGTGGVPYSILKPVLEKATPSQLLRLEYYNSYLTEDSDELWQLHCQKDFRNKTRQECETWREMYERCTDEREARFLTLTASIKESKEKSVPVRTTKIAYIDPPMAGSRRQVKHTAAPMAKAKVEALVRESKASSDVVVTHQRKASRTPSAPSTSSQSKVKKMAPLMAKSLSAFKNRRYKN